MHPNFARELTHRLPGAGGAVLANGRLLGSNGIVFNNHNCIVAEPGRQIAHTGGPFAFRELYQFFRPPISSLRGKWVALTGQGAEGYFHWMLDTLPRLAILQRLIPEPDGYLVPQQAANFARESLTLAGIPHNQIRLVGPGDHIRADALAVASAPSVPGNPPPWAIAFLRERLITSVSPANAPQRRRLVISRENASCRRILNIGDLMCALEPLGFELVEFEKHSLRSQITLCQETSHIVAPHGAGLTNLAFCGKGARVLELFGDDYVNVCFYALADIVGLDYTFAICRHVAPTKKGTNSGDLLLDTSAIAAIRGWASSSGGLS
jgi:capsular polysaccharide biosynthesis protein